jgi:colanic acid/amylovoran biosynthesis glycosyltransferase
MNRVVHSTPVWLPGTQTWIHTQVTRVPIERVECHVVCERTENLEQFPVHHLHDFSAAGALERTWDRGLRRLGLRRHLGYLARTARRVGARLLHSHFGDVAWANLGAARAARCRHVATFYGYDMSRLAQSPAWRARFRQLFDAVDRVLCEGPHMARRIADLGCPESKLRVHHLGISLEQLPYRPRSWAPGGALRVLIAATFTEKKGIPYALEALGRLRRHVDVEVTVIGDARGESAENLSQKEKILGAIAAHGMGDRVRLLGFQPHSRMIEEAYRHHVFLAPSVTAADGDTEGGAPVSILEMAASGMLVVATRHCDIPNVVEDGRSGLLAEERDADGLLDRLLLAVREPQRWPEMLAAARGRVEAEFDARIQGERLAAHYEALLEGGPA